MRCQIDLSILVIWDLVFSVHCVSKQYIYAVSLVYINSPLIEAHIVLNEQQDLIWQIGWPQRSSEVYMF